MASDLTPLIGIDEEEEKEELYTGLINRDDPPKKPDFKKEKFTHQELANTIRNRYPKYQDPSFSDEFIVSEAFRVMPELADQMEDAPTFGEEYWYSSANILKTFQHGIPEVVSDVVQFLPDGPIFDDENYKEWAGNHLKELELWKESKRASDPRFAAWERWGARNTGIDEWSDLADPQLLAKSAANWVSTGIVWAGTAVTTAAAVNFPEFSDIVSGPAVAATTAYSLSALLEGSDEAASSIEYLTQDRLISNEEFKNDLATFESLLPKNIGKKEKMVMMQEFMNNYILNRDGSVSEKGLSIEEAQDVNTAAVLTYAFLLAGPLEMIPATRIMRRVPGMQDAWRKYAHGSILHKLTKNIRRKPYNPSLKGRFLDANAWGGVIGDATAEAVTEMGQYSSQILAETMPGIGYREEGFQDVFSVPSLIESGVMGAISGFSMGAGGHTLLDASGLTAGIENFQARRQFARGGKVYTQYDKDTGTYKLHLKVGNTSSELTAEELGPGIQAEFDKKGLALEAATTLDKELQESFDRTELSNHYDKIDAVVTVEKNEEGKFDVYFTKEGALIGEKQTFDTLTEANKHKRKLNHGQKRLEKLKEDVREEQGQDTIDDIENDTNTSAENDKADEVDADVVAVKSFLGQDLDKTEVPTDEGFASNEDVTYDNPEFILDILKRRGKEVLDKIEGVTEDDLIEMINARAESEGSADSQFNEEESQKILDEIESWQLSEEDSQIDSDPIDTDQIDDQPIDDQTIDEQPIDEFDEENIGAPEEDVETQLNMNFSFNASEATDDELTNKLNELEGKKTQTNWDKQQIDNIKAEQQERQGGEQTLEEIRAERKELQKQLAEAAGDLREQIRLEDAIIENRQREVALRMSSKDKGPKIETVKRYTPESVRENPDKVYLFGDNLEGKGKGGQAIIRDEPNAYGIPTKKKPTMNDDAFFNDAEYDENVKAIDKAFDAIPKDKTIVLPEDGLGTGLARLKEKAPKTWAYLQKRLEELDVTKAPKKQTKSTEQKITERKLKRIVRKLTNKIIFPDGSKIKIKLDYNIDSPGEYDPTTKTIKLNPDEAGMDTPFHEISHPLIDELYANNPEVFESLYNQVVNSKYGKDIIKKLKKEGYEPGSDLFKIEVIAEAIGRVAAGKYKSSSNPIVNAVQRFMNWVREKLFGPMWAGRIVSSELTVDTTIEELANIITKEGVSIKLGDTPKNLDEYQELLLMQIKYQLSAARGLAVQRKQLFNTAYNMFSRMVTLQYGRKKVDGKKVVPDILYFQKFMLGKFSELGVSDLEMPFNEWFNDKFEKSYVLSERRKEITKDKDSKFYLVNGVEADTMLNDVLIRTRMTSSLNEVSDEILEIGTGLEMNTRVWLGAFKMSLTPEQYAKLQEWGRTSPDFFTFQNTVMDNLRLGNVTDFEALTLTQQNLLVQEYVKSRSTIRVNRDEGANARDMYVLRLDMSEGGIKVHSFELKGGKDSQSGLSNNKWEKINMVEAIGNWGIFSVLGEGDFKTKRTLYNPDGTRVNREDGEAVKGWKGRSSFLTEEEIIALNKILYKQGLVLLGTRGELSQMFFAPINDQHRADAQNHEAYWDGEKKYVPKADRDRYKEKQSYEERVIDITMHEAMKAIWPKYHHEKQSKVFKRLKIPTTSALTNREFTTTPDGAGYSIARFNPKNASFVYENQDGTVNTKKVRRSDIPGLGIKEYTGDGATLTSNRFFKALNRYFGFQEGTSKAKTVVYDKRGDDVIMMKHEQFAVDPGVKIYYNYGKPGEKLVAELDANGDIIYYLNDKNGEVVDLLATSDEIKVSTGELDTNIVHMEGKTLGVIKRASKIAPYAKHGMQPYNHLHEPEIIDVFHTHIAPTVVKNMRKLYKMSDKENYSEHMISLLEHLNKNEDAGFQPTIMELMKLGAGRHQSMEPLVNTIVMKNLVEKAISIAEQEGSYFDLSPNFRADLEPGQVALGKQNSRMVYQKYADANDMTLSEARKLTNEEINEWLAENPVHVYITRFPVPHKGGVLMARVMRLTDKKSVIEMHEQDVFVRLEGDFDGDSVQVEMLPDDMVDTFKNVLDNVDVKAINLSRYVVTKFEGKFSNMEDRIKLMDALTQGQKAIGEIANIQSIYGMLINILDEVEVGDMYETKTLKLRKPTETFRWNVPYIDRSGKVQPYRDITVEEYLRTILQAAVDNGEFLLLKNWDYTQMNFLAPLFKDQWGNSAESIDMGRLMPLFEIHKIPGRLRNGTMRRADGELVNIGLTELIEQSKIYTEYVNDREGYFRNLPNAEDLNIYNIKFKQPTYLINESSRDSGSLYNFGQAVGGNELTEMLRIVKSHIDKETGQSTTKGHKAVWYGPLDYTYTGAKHTSKKMPKEIRDIMHQVEDMLGLPRGYYDSVLINEIPAGVPIGRHADNEDILQLGGNTVGSVGVLSLSGESLIKIYDAESKQTLEEVDIEAGDLYELPEGEFNNTRLHSVGASPVPRISLTFRRTRENLYASPIETIAMIPYKTYNDYLAAREGKYGIQLQNGSPFKVHNVVHANAHKAALDRLAGSGWDKLFNIAYKKDGIVNKLSSTEGISIQRDSIYGNPFVVPEVYDKSPNYYEEQGFIRTDSVEEAIERYDAWLRGTGDIGFLSNKRDAILKDIKSGKLSGQTLKYFKPKAKDSHAVRLIQLIQELGPVKNIDMKKEMEKGARWAEDMSAAWFELITSSHTINSTTLDRSESFLMFKEKYDAEYRTLSETAKMAATFQFLKLYSKGVYAGRAGFPPASLSKKEYQTLHEKVLQKYFKYYNEALDSSTDSSLVESNTGYGTNETLNDIANRSCNI